jgi:hypothetical protein
MPSNYSELEIQEIGKRAWKTASRAAKHMSKHSKIVNPSMEKCIPRFEREEVILGDVLGSGGFNDVYEVKQINLVEDLTKSKHAKKISSPLQNEHRAFVAKHVFRESSQNCRYAVKFLSVETIEDPNRFCTGAADLVVVCRISHGVDRNCPLVGTHRCDACVLLLTFRRPNFWRRFLIRTLSSFVEWQRPGHLDLPV